MEVSEALDILRGNKPENKPENNTPPTDEEPRKIYDRRADIMTSVKGAALGLILMILLYNLLVHPIDRLLIKMAVLDNYTISVKAGGFSPEIIQVDGNVMYADGKYYEIVGDERYIYEEYNGRWTKQLDYSYTGDEDADVGGLGELLKKENYKRSFFPWVPLKYIGPDTGIQDVKMRISGGKCHITGYVVENYYNMRVYYVYIDIEDFGTTKVTLPEID